MAVPRAGRWGARRGRLCSVGTRAPVLASGEPRGTAAGEAPFPPAAHVGSRPPSVPQPTGRGPSRDSGEVGGSPRPAPCSGPLGASLLPPRPSHSHAAVHGTTFAATAPATTRPTEPGQKRQGERAGRTGRRGEYFNTFLISVYSVLGSGVKECEAQIPAPEMAQSLMPEQPRPGRPHQGPGTNPPHTWICAPTGNGVQRTLPPRVPSPPPPHRPYF